MSRGAPCVLGVFGGFAAACAFSACETSNLDAGTDIPHGPLPVDERNPIVIVNDGPRDNWQGEFALVLASLGQINLAGIIVDATNVYPTLETNTQGWRDMVKAARDSGMRNIPDPTASTGGPLQRPADGAIASTQPHGSEGARLIVDTARRLSQPLRPIVVASGSGLTEAADAYLIDPGIADRVVVIAALGHSAADGSSASMIGPNGPIDPWADEIVARKLRYVQVDAYYAQQNDVPQARVAELPANPFGVWMTSKVGEILPLPGFDAADQISVIAGALPAFALDVARMSETSPTPPAAGETPILSADATGNAWIVISGDATMATARFWQALKDPATYGR
jgi:hypothetical protein